MMTTACWIGLGAIVLFFILALMGVKICYAMLASGIAGLIFINGINGAISVTSTALFSMVSSFDYAVLPMFILMATIITETGMGTSLLILQNMAWTSSWRTVYNVYNRLRCICCRDCFPLGVHHGGGSYSPA